MPPPIIEAMRRPISMARNAFQSVAQNMQRSRFCLITTFLMALFVAGSLSVAIKPLPKVHDEFSYLLAADALSQWKTSAEPHPHWPHFESFHIIHQPRYASKYPPGQGFLLALGKRLGHPIVGAIFATALSTTAIMWMIIGWIPKKFHWFASQVLATHPGLQILWGQSYMGGAIAISGGALLLGAFFRLNDKLDWRLSAVAGVGTSFLMYSRPLEGAVLTVTVVLALTLRFLNTPTWNLQPFGKRIVAPAAAILLLSASLLAAYNQSITGHPTRMPYQIYEHSYGWVPLFLWQSPEPEMPSYRHDVIEKFYRDDYNARTTDYASWLTGLRQKWNFVWESEYFFLGSTLVFSLFAIPSLLRQSRFRIAMLVVLPAFLAGCVTPWGHTHYLAPIGGVVLLFGIAGLIHMWEKWNFVSNKKMLLTAVLFAHLFWFGKELYRIQDSYKNNWWVRRDQIEQKLNSSPGKDLVFVRYGKEHIAHQEWVYNSLDLDSADVIWAREISADKDLELIRYFADRQIWVVEPENNRTITPIKSHKPFIAH